LNSKHAFAVFIASFLWSSSYSLSKWTLDYFPPSTLAFIRFLITIALLGTTILVMRKNVALGSLRLHKIIALSGVLGYTMFYVLQNTALLYCFASDAVLLATSFPVITAIIERLVFKKPIPATNWLGIGVAIIGVTVIIQPWAVGNTMNPERLLGIGLTLLAGVCWAIYGLIINRLQDVDTSLITLWQVLYGSIMLLPFVLWERPVFTGIPPTAWFILVYLALFSSLIAYLLYNYGLKGIQPNQAVNILNTMPLFGLIVAYFLLGESLNLIQGFGGLIVILGVCLSLSKQDDTSPAVLKVSEEKVI